MMMDHVNHTVKWWWWSLHSRCLAQFRFGILCVLFLCIFFRLPCCCSIRLFVSLFVCMFGIHKNIFPTKWNNWKYFGFFTERGEIEKETQWRGKKITVNKEQRIIWEKERETNSRNKQQNNTSNEWANERINKYALETPSKYPIDTHTWKQQQQRQHTKKNGTKERTSGEWDRIESKRTPENWVNTIE